MISLWLIRIQAVFIYCVLTLGELQCHWNHTKYLPMIKSAEVISRMSSTANNSWLVSSQTDNNLLKTKELVTISRLKFANEARNLSWKIQTADSGFDRHNTNKHDHILVRNGLISKMDKNGRFLNGISKTDKEKFENVVYSLLREKSKDSFNLKNRMKRHIHSLLGLNLNVFGGVTFNVGSRTSGGSDTKSSTITEKTHTTFIRNTQAIDYTTQSSSANTDMQQSTENNVISTVADTSSSDIDNIGDFSSTTTEIPSYTSLTTPSQMPSGGGGIPELPIYRNIPDGFTDDLGVGQTISTDQVTNGIPSEIAVTIEVELTLNTKTIDGNVDNLLTTVAPTELVLTSITIEENEESDITSTENTAAVIHILSTHESVLTSQTEIPSTTFNSLTITDNPSTLDQSEIEISTLASSTSDIIIFSTSTAQLTSKVDDTSSWTPTTEDKVTFSSSSESQNYGETQPSSTAYVLEVTEDTGSPSSNQYETEITNIISTILSSSSEYEVSETILPSSSESQVSETILPSSSESQVSETILPSSSESSVSETTSPSSTTELQYSEEPIYSSPASESTELEQTSFEPSLLPPPSSEFPSTFVSPSSTEFQQTTPPSESQITTTTLTLSTAKLTSQPAYSSSSTISDLSSPTADVPIIPVNILPFKFTIDADYDIVVGSRKAEFESGMGLQLARVMRVPLTCIQNLQATKGSVEISFQLVPNSEYGHLADEKALQAAAAELKRRIDSGELNITDLDGNTLVVIPIDVPTTPPPAEKIENNTLVLSIVIGVCVLTIIILVILAILIKRKSSYVHRLSPIEEANSQLPVYRKIPFQEALFIHGLGSGKVKSTGKYCYNSGVWLGPGAEPRMLMTPEPVFYRPPTDTEISGTPRPPTAVRERLKKHWDVEWDTDTKHSL